MNKVVLISSCLLGIASRHDGRDAKNKKLLESLKGFVLIPVCPEQLGGLPTPRKAAEIQKGRGKAALKGTGHPLGERVGFGRDGSGRYKAIHERRERNIQDNAPYQCRRDISQGKKPFLRRNVNQEKRQNSARHGSYCRVFKNQGNQGKKR